MYTRSHTVCGVRAVSQKTRGDRAINMADENAQVVPYAAGNAGLTQEEINDFMCMIEDWHGAHPDEDDQLLVNMLRNKPAYCHCQTEDGYTGLHCAAEYGNVSAMQSLILAGADVNRVTEEYETPIFLLIKHANGASHLMLNMLIQAHADVNLCNEFGDSPLHIAVEKKSCELALELSRILLEAGANVNRANNDERTPLHNAVENGCGGEIVDLLLEYNPAISADRHNYTPLHSAVMLGREEEVKSLLRVIDCSDGKGPMHMYDADGNTPLHLAVLYGENTCLQYLLEAADRDNCKSVIVNDLNCNNKSSALHYAVVEAKKGEYDILETLIKAGANLNVQNDYGETPLYTAVMNDHYEEAMRLIQAGADWRVKDRSGRIAFQMARSDKMERLLEASQNNFAVEALAFSMGSHKRLGDASHVSKLSNDMVNMILREYYKGEKKEYFDVSSPENRYLHVVLKEMLMNVFNSWKNRRRNPG